MAVMKGGSYIEGAPKKSRQGKGKHTKLSATSRNGAKKRYRGQGKRKPEFSYIPLYGLNGKPLIL